MRLEITYINPEYDGRAHRLLTRLKKRVPDLVSLTITDIIMMRGIDGLSDEEAAALFSDAVVQRARTDKPVLSEQPSGSWSLALEATVKPGVTDPVAITARQTIESFLGRRILSPPAVVQTARQYAFLFRGSAAADPKVLSGLIHNPLIETVTAITSKEWEAGKRFPSQYPHAVPPSAERAETVPILSLDDSGLTDLSRSRLLALSLTEMRAVRDYFAGDAVAADREKAGLPADPTDVELEMIAQTWSEHCKHKIFQADITYTEAGAAGGPESGNDNLGSPSEAGTSRTEEIRSLFKTYIRAVTEELKAGRPDLCSVFTDNSGVVRFTEDYCVCFKVETHNSPSALDPYDGAITGIVGVNRDILGTGKGAKPIFNTNVLCFGYGDTDPGRIPEGLLHPSQVMEGVHRGIIDGGNQSGIPTAAGAFLFDESYLGKPLVFCGTGGLLPASINGEAGWIKHVEPGDKAVMLGGRIGKDGIHGATFSSEALTEASPTSAVQIGDPIIQKKMTDFLLEARDSGLYKGITDNGAGGLSSSLGEMAELSGGVRIDLHLCPLKYQGLAPWEILVSESQERMSLAVGEETLSAFMDLARRRDVEAAVVGEFTDSGYAEMTYKDAVVGRLSLGFLHNGLPGMKLRAVWNPRRRTGSKERGTRHGACSAAGRDSSSGGGNLTSGNDLTHVLLRLLAEPNIASKETLVRQYDHEVQALSVVKPFCGPAASGPTDGAVLRPVHTTYRGLTVTHGICPRYGDVDTYHMAMCAVDEAYRSHIALGGNPSSASALDNFCWPDPVASPSTPDGEYKLAQLVRACKGLKEACTAYGLPLISGKDSMKNDARIGGKKVSVRPTLLVSLLGVIDDARKAVTSDFKVPGDAIYVLGATNGELGGTMFEKLGVPPDQDVPGGYEQLGPCPVVDVRAARRLYDTLAAWMKEWGVKSCHDCSDGGLGIAIAESAVAGSLGCEIDAGGLPGKVFEGIGVNAGISGGGMNGSGLRSTQTAQDFPAAQVLFCESPSRFVVSINPDKEAAFEAFFKDVPCKKIGTVTGPGRTGPGRGTGKAGDSMPLSDLSVRISLHGREIVSASIEALQKAWQGRFA